MKYNSKKVVVSPEKIVFNGLFYQIEVPQNGLKMTFYDYRFTVGMPIFIYVNSPYKKISSRFGLFGIFCYWILSFYFLISWLFTNPFLPKERCFINRIEYVKNINKFFSDLQRNGYSIEDSVSQLEKIKKISLPKKLEPGTKEWKKDKRLLVVIVYLSFVVLIFLPLFINKNKTDFNDSYALLLLFIFFSLICYSVFRALSRAKK